MQRGRRNQLSAYDAVLVDDRGAPRPTDDRSPVGTGPVGLATRLTTVAALLLGAIWFWPGDDSDHVSAVGPELQLSTTTAAVTTTSEPALAVGLQGEQPTSTPSTTASGQPTQTTTSAPPDPGDSTDLGDSTAESLAIESDDVRKPLRPLVATTPAFSRPQTTAPSQPGPTLDRSTTTRRTTTTRRPATARQTTTTTRPNTTRQTATTTRPSTTRQTTTTTRATTTTTTTTTTRQTTTTSRPTTTTTRQTTTSRPTTTTTRPTTTTSRPTTTTTVGGTCATNGEFERVMRDDFGGSSVAGHWLLFNGNGNAGFGERRRSAASVENGRLIITAQMENGSLVSGGMSHRYDQTYGKYRFRVRTDEDPSEAMSGVVLTWPQSQQHPRDGENNIYETLANAVDRNPFYSFIHEPFGTKSDQKRFVHSADGSQFQIMTMEWTPDHISITREGPGGGQYIETQTLNETSDDLIPDNPHKLHIQLDAWEHSISGAVRMEVDWVEVYKYCG